MIMNLETTIEVTNGLKTLNNLNYTAFRELLFPDAMDYYVEDKWSLFREDMLRFIWSCSYDRIELIVNYINGEV
jgi:hypothetical protein